MFDDFLDSGQQLPQSGFALDRVLLSMVSAAPPHSWHVVLLHLSVPATAQRRCYCIGGVAKNNGDSGVV